MCRNSFLSPAEPFRFRMRLRSRRARGSIGLVIANAAFHFHACGELPHDNLDLLFIDKPSFDSICRASFGAFVF